LILVDASFENAAQMGRGASQGSAKIPFKGSFFDRFDGGHPEDHEVSRTSIRGQESAGWRKPLTRFAKTANESKMSEYLVLGQGRSLCFHFDLIITRTQGEVETALIISSLESAMPPCMLGQ
jgi:hypothetical protein